MRITAGVEGVVFISHGDRLLGALYRPSVEDGAPATILLHGVPGVEQNLDIAYALRDAGWNTLLFHYRGSWGSEGSYSLAGLADDLRAATDWLIERPSVDPSRIAVVGMSMGGYVALAGMAADPRFVAAVALSPMLDPLRLPLSPEIATDMASMLRGLTGEELVRQWASCPPISSLADRLVGRPILMVVAGRDELVPPGHEERVVKAIPTIVVREFEGEGHVFASARQPLVTTVVDWLLSVL